jgi:hypothetical protein
MSHASARTKKWKKFLKEHLSHLTEYVEIVEKPSLGKGQLAIIAKKAILQDEELLDSESLAITSPGNFCQASLLISFL